jgi:uncharacterized protein YlxW (UPF0749 family)
MQNGASVSTPRARDVRDELTLLRAENARLRNEIRELQAALDAHVARCRSTQLFAPVELTPGTSVGPRRRRRER